MTITRVKAGWETLDWQALDRLRGIFLAEEKPRGDYWRSRADLENYDFTFGQRIAWKWDAVLNELRRINWTPPADSVLDWGCGSGVACRCVIGHFGPEKFRSLQVTDQSAAAMEFATGAAQAAFPCLHIESTDAAGNPLGCPPYKNPSRANCRARSPKGFAPSSSASSVGLLVVSHVLNELNDQNRGDLLRLADRAEAVLWVEPGTYADSRTLIEMREALRDRFNVVAPCTHREKCGMLTPENERHWCHFFAQPPANIMADSNWVRFAQRVGIDLRRLPYSYLVMERRTTADRSRLETAPTGECLARIIGAPRMYKGFAKVLACQCDGVREVTVQKRDDPELFRALKNGEAQTTIFHGLH